MEDLDRSAVARQYFGHADFRPGQEPLIDALLSGRDALGVMPTGGGKSLCYQVPALLLPGLTLVVSPLISLMKDQVAALREAGVEAAFLNSSLTPEQFRTACARLREGRYKLVYVAPERLEQEGFAALLESAQVSLVAVDEAHCISQWGQDFRPSYLKIAQFVDSLPRRPVVAAFTATATRQVREDIVRLLGLRDPLCVVTGFDRPNLYFEVRRPKDKMAALIRLLREREGKSGVVYCATRAGVERVWAGLEEAGVSAARYHAGLPDQERRENQDDFQYDRRPVMVATNAFGMGIDKSNVSFVIHYNMPKSLEAYYQEAGRAGRDGSAADCILLYSPGDVTTAKFLIEHGGNGELSGQEQARVREMDYRRLEAMSGYCKTTRCLRGYILDYFGQAHQERCGNCGSCLGEYVQTDVTRQAQMVLSCVKRLRDKLGYSVGATLLVQVLRGSRTRRVLELGLDSLSTYGLMADLPRGQVQGYIEHLEQEGFLRADPEHGGLYLTAKAGEVLFRGERVVMPLRAEERGAPEENRSKRRNVPEEESGLMAALKATRTRLAQREGVPAYIIFSNAALADMEQRLPRTMEQFLEVSGVGRVKAARYGVAFLRTIQEYLEKT